MVAEPQVKTRGNASPVVNGLTVGFYARNMAQLGSRHDDRLEPRSSNSRTPYQAQGHADCRSFILADRPRDYRQHHANPEHHQGGIAGSSSQCGG